MTKKKHTNFDLTYAFNSEGKLVNIEDVDSGKKCNCFCPACQESLVAKKGTKNRHHFAHSSGTNCGHAVESMLHHLAKDKIQEAFYKNEEFIIEFQYKSYCIKSKECKYTPLCECCEIYNKRFNLKEYYDSCEQEVKYDNINGRSDLKIFSSTNPTRKPIYLEFCVTHPSTSEKLHSGNKIIEIVIESEEDINNILEKGIIEDKDYNEENISKVAFYDFENKDYKNNNIISEIKIARFSFYDSGKMGYNAEYINCNNVIKKSKKSLLEVCFHFPQPIFLDSEIKDIMKYLCYKKYKIKNCQLCKNYVKSYSLLGGIICRCYKSLQIPYEEIYKLNTERAKQCPKFYIDVNEMDMCVKRGLKGFVYDILH
jgi:hypothetical protein